MTGAELVFRYSVACVDPVIPGEVEIPQLPRAHGAHANLLRRRDVITRGKIRAIDLARLSWGGRTRRFRIHDCVEVKVDDDEGVGGTIYFVYVPFAWFIARDGVGPSL
jgi:hypothetical protein